MHDSSRSPLVDTSYASARKASPSQTIRNIRLDESSEQSLKAIQAILAGIDERDTVSVSLAFRRALKFYSAYLEANPNAVPNEQFLVRRNSKLPHPRRRRDS